MKIWYWFLSLLMNIYYDILTLFLRYKWHEELRKHYCFMIRSLPL